MLRNCFWHTYYQARQQELPLLNSLDEVWKKPSQAGVKIIEPTTLPEEFAESLIENNAALQNFDV